MGLYSRTEEAMLEAESPLISFLENEFGETMLDEDATELRHSIMEDAMNGSLTVEKFGLYLAQMEGCNFNSFTTKMLMEDLYDGYLKSYNAEVELEYSGNPKLNEEYKRALQQVEAWFLDSDKLIDHIFKTGDEMLAELEKLSKMSLEKDETKIKVGVNKIYSLMDKVSKIDADWETHIKNYQNFDKLNRKFSIKFSNITMEEKKAFDKKLDQLAAKIMDGDIKKWVKFQDLQNQTPAYDKLVVDFEKFKEVDRERALKLLNECINPYIRYQCSVVFTTVGNINVIRRKLGIERENKLLYKVIQRLIKK